MDAPTVAVSDVMVILDDQCEDRFAKVVERLQQLGAHVAQVDLANGMVEATIESAAIPELRRLECVDHVRVVFNYWARLPLTAESRDQRILGQAPPSGQQGTAGLQ